MALLNNKYMQFDENDFQIMENMLKKFRGFRTEAGRPENAPNYVEYLPVFAIALLASQEAVDKLTKRLLCLTWIIAILTGVMVLSSVILYLKG